MNSLYIDELKVINFRKLKNLNIKLNDEKTILVGKNNTGKTSLIKAIDIFQNNTLKNTDINVEEIKKIIDKIFIKDENIDNMEISLEIILKYNENCDFRTISKYMDKILINGKIKIKYKYKISSEKAASLIEKTDKIKKSKESYIENNIIDILEYEVFLNDKKQKNKIKVSDMINMKYISANRKVDNDVTNKINSVATQKVLDSGIQEIQTNEALRDIVVSAEIESNDLIQTDNFFNNFKEIINNLTGLVGNDVPNVSIDYSNILTDPKVNLTFNNNGIEIPEYNSGLGYANFYSLLLNIISFIDNINRNNIKNSLLIIEEPEAYTHPQMQYIFNENINKILEKNLKTDLQVQYIIVTHSPQIVTTSESKDILIFKEVENQIKYNKFSDLIASDERFFKQYFKLTNSELVFADKVIFLEGDTEELLIKECFEKFDNEIEVSKRKFLEKFDESTAEEEDINKKKYFDNYIPLMKQNISILPVGTQANKFSNIINSLELKTLIITDIDFIGKNGKKSTFKESERTSNPTLNEIMFNNITCSPKIKTKEINKIKFSTYKKCKNNWNVKNLNYKDNTIIVHQTKIRHKLSKGVYATYYPRTFEDSFLMTNYNIIKDKKELRSLYANESKIFKENLFTDQTEDYNKILLKLKGKKDYSKVGLAFELLTSEADWRIPEYIKKGLKWLQSK